MLDTNDVIDVDTRQSFDDAALKLFEFQAHNCAPYAEYIDKIGVRIDSVKRVEQIPFLPIEIFKHREVYCGAEPPEQIFTSSSTGGQGCSRHYMHSLQHYELIFRASFEYFYGSPKQWGIYALLPNYLEREGSSLVYMADKLIDWCGSGDFYLDDYEELLHDMSCDPKRKILLGVSYALWDLAEQYSPKLADTFVMETGGMKGRREELPRADFHSILCNAFGVKEIHSEYGMAELTSQAYSVEDGLFECTPWMRVYVRDVNDPFDVRETGRGGINIIDLANLYSCAFIQTQDVGSLIDSGEFTIDGRIDFSEIRGCNLLVQ